MDLVVDVLVGEGDRQGRLLVAVDDCRHFAVAANISGGPLTDPFARFGLELVRIVAHGFSFRVFWSVRGWHEVHVRKRRKPPDWAAFRRVASKGVYAGGGSIAEGQGERKVRRPRRLLSRPRPKRTRRAGLRRASEDCFRRPARPSAILTIARVRARCAIPNQNTRDGPNASSGAQACVLEQPLIMLRMLAALAGSQSTNSSTASLPSLQSILSRISAAVCHMTNELR